MLDGEFDQIGEVAETQFLHQPTTVCFYGFRGEVEDLADLFAGLSFNDKLQDLSFTGT